jgi:hypothetical protein
MATAPRTAVPSFKFPKTVGAKVDHLVGLRDKKRDAQEVVDKIEEEMKALEVELLDQMDKEGTVKITGKNATASISETTVFTLEDDDAFFKFVHKHKYFHLFQRRLSDPAVREIFESKGVVPGCSPFVKRKINLRAV